MATYGAAPDDGDLEGLFEASPDPGVHTSAAAETAFLLGLIALLAAPFSVMHTLSLGAAVASAFLAFVGVAMTSRPHVAGRMLAPLGLFLALTALVLVGLRYLGLDTAFGDPLVPTLHEWLVLLNSSIPHP